MHFSFPSLLSVLLAISSLSRSVPVSTVAADDTGTETSPAPPIRTQWLVSNSDLTLYLELRDPLDQALPQEFINHIKQQVNGRRRDDLRLPSDRLRSTSRVPDLFGRTILGVAAGENRGEGD